MDLCVDRGAHSKFRLFASWPASAFPWALWISVLFKRVWIAWALSGLSCTYMHTSTGILAPSNDYTFRLVPWALFCSSLQDIFAHSSKLSESSSAGSRFLSLQPALTCKTSSSGWWNRGWEQPQARTLISIVPTQSSAAFPGIKVSHDDVCFW